MKNLLIATALLLSVGCVNAQKLKPSQVPEPVKAKMVTLYPSAEKTHWGKEGDNYEAEFENNEVETSCLFDASGNLLETETEIAVSALPQGARDYVAKNLAGKKISEASKIIDASGKITFEAEVGGVDYLFDDAGNFIKSVKE